MAKLTLLEARRRIELDILPQLTVAFADGPVARDRIALEVLDGAMRFTTFVVGQLCQYL